MAVALDIRHIAFDTESTLVCACFFPSRMSRMQVEALTGFGERCGWTDPSKSNSADAQELSSIMQMNGLAAEAVSSFFTYRGEQPLHEVRLISLRTKTAEMSDVKREFVPL